MDPPDKIMVSQDKQTVHKVHPSTNQLHHRPDRMKQPSMCSFSVYRYMLSKLKVKTVHCEVTPRTSNLKFMTAQLGNMELLSKDVDEFIKNETGLQRLKRYFTRDSMTGEYPGNYGQFVRSGVNFLGGVSLLTWAFSIYANNKEFRKVNPYSYKERRFQMNRILPLVSNGFVSGLKIAWVGTRLFVPFVAVSLGLTIFFNNTNPLNFALGFGVSSGLNYNVMGSRLGLPKTSLMGSVAGLILGCGVYYQQKRTEQLQEMVNKDSVRKKLYHESPSKYR